MVQDNKATHRSADSASGSRLEFDLDLAEGNAAHSIEVKALGYRAASVEYYGVGNAGQGTIEVKEGNRISPSTHKTIAAGVVTLAEGDLKTGIDITTHYLSLHYSGGGTGKLKVIVVLKAH